MTPQEAARRFLMDAAGEPLCVPCLAGVCGTTLAEMQAISEILLGENTFQRGWTCASCARPRATIVYIRKCAHCSAPLDPSDRGSRIGGDLFHAACLSRLMTDHTIRLSHALSQRSRTLIEQSRRRMSSSHATIRRPAAAREALVARGRRRALIVDDNRDDRDTYAYYLEHAGWYVELAADAESGIRLAQREPFDIIVMAISTPQVDGAEVTRRLEADERTRAIPMLVVTKPCPPERLAEDIERILGTSGIP